MVDGRAAERYAVSLPVEVTSAAQAGAMEATVRDINSEGSVFLSLRKESEVSPEIELAIALPEQLMRREDVRVECKATVVRLERDADDALVGVAAKITGLKLATAKRPEVEEAQA